MSSNSIQTTNRCSSFPQTLKMAKLWYTIHRKPGSPSRTRAPNGHDHHRHPGPSTQRVSEGRCVNMVFLQSFPWICFTSSGFCSMSFRGKDLCRISLRCVLGECTHGDGSPQTDSRDWHLYNVFVIREQESEQRDEMERFSGQPALCSPLAWCVHMCMHCCCGIQSGRAEESQRL